MKLIVFFATLVLTLLLSTCGGDGGTGGENSEKNAEKVFDPWESVGGAFLPEEAGAVTGTVRVLEFGDGMAISYDGSDAAGEEQVCRREEDEGTWYEVCMPLEDDPYFVLLPNNAFVWHPLMFDRFATELNCKSWMTDEDTGAETNVVTDCAAVLSGMGGEDFNCQAGVVNGDKALKCSDDWAVAVNGDDDDTKSVCRVHIGNGSGRCLGAPKEKVTDQELILEMQKTSWDGYRSLQDNERQFIVGESAQALIPQELPKGAKLYYRSQDEEVCTVDNDDSDGGLGLVTVSDSVTAPTICKVLLKITARGFADRLIFVRLPVLKPNDTTWADYERINNYFYPGESLDVGEITSNEPPATEKGYESLDEAVCTIDSIGTITAVAPGECTVRLTAKAEDYLDAIIEKTVRVGTFKQFMDIVWEDFPSAARVGVNTLPLGDPVVQDDQGDPVSADNLTVTITTISQGCTYDHATKVISFLNKNECSISIAASGPREYEQKLKIFNVTPESGRFNLSWAGYTGGNTAMFASTAPNPENPVTTPDLSDAAYTYTASGGACEVDANTGALTLIGATVETSLTCTVTINASSNGYQGESTSQTVIINKAAQTLSPPDNPYGSATSVTIGEELTILNPPDNGKGSVIYGKKNGSCTVDTGNGSLTTTGATTENCVVQARWSGDDNHAPSPDATIATIKMVSTSNPAAKPVWGSNPYLTNPVVGGSSVAPVAPTGSGTGSLEYKSKTPDKCSVNNATGAVTGLTAGDGCIVQARFTGNQTTGPSQWADSPGITIDKGDPVPPTNPYGSGAMVGVGKTLLPETSLDGFGTATYTLGSGSETYCQIGADGTLKGLAAGANKCTVQVSFGGNNNYNPTVNPIDLQTITVTPGSQIIQFSEPYGETLALKVGESLPLVNAPESDQGGAISYRIKNGLENHCRVNGTDGTLEALAPGECIVQASAAAVAPNYAISEWVDTATLLVQEGELASITWNPQRRVRWNEELILAAVNAGSGGATASYEVKDAKESGCQFKGTTGNDARTLEFTGPGVCVVTATATKQHYGQWSRDHAIRVMPGIIGVTVGAFANGAKLSVGVDTPKVPTAYSGLNPSDADVSWKLVRGERDCILKNSQTGAVVAKAVPFHDAILPKCSLILTAKKDKYKNYKSAPVEIPLQKGDMPVSTAPVYGLENTPTTTLPIDGRALDMLITPHVGNGLMGVPVAVSVVGQGKADGEVCTVDNDRNSETFGRVSIGSNPVAGDQCLVTVTMTAIGYDRENSVTLALTVVGDTFSFDVRPSIVYSDGVLQHGSDETLIIDQYASDLPAVDSAGVAVQWHWQVRGMNANGEDKPGVCGVENHGDTNPGKLSLGGAAVAGDICQVYAIAKATNYADYSAPPLDVMIEKGVLSFADTATVMPSYGGRLRVGGELPPLVPMSPLDDNDVAITWGGWEVVGDDADGSDARDVCTIDDEGVIRADGSAASAGDTCTIYATGSAPHYADAREEIFTLTLVEVEAIDDNRTLKAPIYGDLTLRGYPIGYITPPTITPTISDAIVRWEYSAQGKRGGEPVEGICSVNGYGRVTPEANAEIGDTCEIIASAMADGFSPADASTVTLNLKETFISLAWADFPTEGTVGVDINLSNNQPSSVPEADTYTITPLSEDCAYNSGSKTLSFTNTTACIIKVTASKADHSDMEATYSLLPTVGTLATIQWGSFSGTLEVGGSTATPVAATGPGITGATITYALKTGSESHCTLEDAATGAVRAKEVTTSPTKTCTIIGTASRTGYTSVISNDISIDLSIGTLAAINWGSFSGTLEVGGSTATPSVPTGAGTTGAKAASISYALKSGSEANCELISAATGEVRAKEVATTPTKTCTIVGTASRTGYTSKTGDISIDLSIGILGAITWGSFSGTLEVGGSTATPGAPTGAGTTGAKAAGISYALKSGSETNCELVSAATGEVRAKEVATTPTKTCTIVGTASRTGYTSKTGDISIDLSIGTLGAITWGSFSGTLEVGGSTATPGAPTGAGTTGAKAAGISYALKSGSETNCELVSGTTGEVRAKEVATTPTRTCTIVGTASRTGYTSKTGDISIDLSIGTLGAITWGSFSGTLEVGGSTATPIAPTGAGTTGAKAAGISYALKSGSEANCELVSAATGEVRAKEVATTPTKTCTIVGTASRTGYTSKTDDISIDLSIGTQGTINWGSFSGTLQVGGGRKIPSAPSGAGVSGATISYALKAGSATNCSLTNTSTGQVEAIAVDLSSTKTCTIIGTATRTGLHLRNRRYLH